MEGFTGQRPIHGQSGISRLAVCLDLLYCSATYCLLGSVWIWAWRGAQTPGRVWKGTTQPHGGPLDDASGSPTWRADFIGLLALLAAGRKGFSDGSLFFHAHWRHPNLWQAGREEGQIISTHQGLNWFELGLGLFKALVKYLKLEIIFAPQAASFYLNLYVERPAHSIHLFVSPEAMVRLPREVLNFNVQRNLIMEPFFSPLTQQITSRASAFLHCSFPPSFPSKHNPVVLCGRIYGHYSFILHFMMAKCFAAIC